MSSIRFEGNASQSVTASSSSQYHHAPQHHHLSEHHRSSQHHHPSQCTIAPVSAAPVRSSGYYGPVRSSPLIARSRNASNCNQNRASPYNINSPRMARRPVDQQGDELDRNVCNNNNQNFNPVNATANNLDPVERVIKKVQSVENEIQGLHSKLDKALKTILRSLKPRQEITTSRPKVKLTPVLWNDKNLLDEERKSLPTGYLCYLVRTMYTCDEIVNKIPQLSPEPGDIRREKIKECLVQLYFSHKPSLFEDFMDTKAKTSLYDQERNTRRSMKQSKSSSKHNDNNNKMNNNEDDDLHNIENHFDDFDVDSNLDVFNH